MIYVRSGSCKAINILKKLVTACNTDYVSVRRVYLCISYDSQNNEKIDSFTEKAI